MDDAKKILDFLKFSEKLKTQLRDNLLSDGRNESVADHSWHLALMALLVSPHLKNKVDLLKSFKMILIHDLAEAEIGDLPFHKSYKDPKLNEEKKFKEKEEIEKIKNLIGGELGQEVYDLWGEYEKQESFESKFVKALDTLEADYQALLYGDISYWEDIYYKLVFTKSDKHCEHEEILREINKEIKSRTEPEMKKIGLNVDKLKDSLEV